MSWLCLVALVMSDSLRPQGRQPTRLLCPWDSPGENTGVGCHSLLRWIFPTQWLNPCLLHWQADSLPLSQLGSPITVFPSSLLWGILSLTSFFTELAITEMAPWLPGWPSFQGGRLRPSGGNLNLGQAGELRGNSYHPMISLKGVGPTAKVLGTALVSASLSVLVPLLSLAMHSEDCL